MATSRINISNKFENGDVPSQSDFGEIFGSFVHKDEDKANFQMVETGTDDQHYVTPALLRTGLQNIGIITGNCYMPFKEHIDNFSGTTLSLEKLPIQYSVKTYKNGQLLLEGEDYTLNYDTAVLTFSSNVSDRNIEVDYWYKNFGPNPGNAGDAIDFTNFLHTTGNETKSGLLTFNNTTPASTSGIILKNSGAGASSLDVTNSGAGNGISLQNSSTGTGVKVSNAGAGVAINVNSESGSTADILQVAKNSVVRTKIDSEGTITAPKFVTAGGLRSQFIKGDGFPDPTVYAEDNKVIHTTGNESRDGALNLIHDASVQDVLTITKNNSANCLKLVQNSSSNATTSTIDTTTENVNRKAISIQKVHVEKAFITHDGNITGTSFTTLNEKADITDGLLTLAGSASPVATAGHAKLYAKTDGTTDMYVMGSDGVEKKIGGIVDLSGKENNIVPGTTAQYYRGDKSWQMLDKAAVGLANVDNTSDLNKPVSTATQEALNLKANLLSPSLTGVPTAPTPTVGTNTTQIATTAFVLANASTPDATTTVKGIVKLAGDLGGTADLPTTPTALHKTGDETKTGRLSFVKTDLSDGGITMTNSAEEGVMFDLKITSEGVGIQSYTSAGGVGFLASNNNGVGFYSVNGSVGAGILSSNRNIGNGIYSDNYDAGNGIYSVNHGKGNGVVSESLYGSTGFNYTGRENGVNNFSVNSKGKVIVGSIADDGVNQLQVNGTISANPSTTANQVVVKSQLDLKAGLNSPAFTGIPTAPTATVGTNNTQIATTAFVTAVNGNYVDKTTTQIINGNKTFRGITTFSSSGGDIGRIVCENTNDDEACITTNSMDSSSLGLKVNISGPTGSGIWINNTINTPYAFKNSYNSSVNMSINHLGVITASSFIKTGGTNLQYLMADGSVSTSVTAAVEPSQITITTAVSITTDTLDTNSKKQIGKNVIINNGANPINITVNGGTDFCASYLKHGVGAITFVQAAGRTLVQVNTTAILNGAVGSTATISSIGTTDYLRISNV
jgi:hypothetical protein